MKKFAIFCFLLIGSTAVLARSYDVSHYDNTNQLIWDTTFREHTKSFFKEDKVDYLWKAPTSKQIFAALGGAPDAIRKVAEKTYLASACRAHSCIEKGAYISNPSSELYALIAFNCPIASGDLKFSNKGCLVIFYQDEKSKTTLSDYLIKWQEQYYEDVDLVYRKLN